MKMKYLVQTKSGKIGFVPRLKPEELKQIPEGFRPVYLCDPKTFELKKDEKGKEVKLMCVSASLKVMGYCD